MCIFDILKIIERLVSIIFSSVSAFGIVFGLIMAYNYKLKRREKLQDSLSSFYARLNIYLLDLKNKLGDSPDRSILLCKYNESSIRSIDFFTKPSGEDIKSFEIFILEFIDFLKNTNNQIPLDKPDYLQNFKRLQRELFDLAKVGRVTPYTDYNRNEPVITEYKRIISLVDTLLEEIDKPI